MARKMHRIALERFKMDINTELTCLLGMSILCRIEGGWGQEGDPVAFYYKGHRLAGPTVHIGDNIFMDHDGPRTTWVIARKPRDPRLSLLWEFGYRSATRVQVADSSPSEVAYTLRAQAFGTAYTEGPSRYNSYWNDYGAFVGDGFKSPTIIKNAKVNEVLVALFSGRVYGADSTFCRWFMSEKATITDVKSALLADCSLNQKHPLLQ